MHILIALVAIIGVAGAWYWRFKMAKEAADEITDAAGKAKGWWNRRQFRKKAEGSAIGAVNDPATAATIMMVAIVSAEGAISAEQRQAIETEMKSVMNVDKTAEMFTFAQWAAGQVVDPNTISMKFQKLWMDNLSESECGDLIAMIERVVAIDGGPTSHQRNLITKLKQRILPER